jgi:hypothetical protein
MQKHAVERVLNLVDYQRFLFEESELPALVVRYRKKPPWDSRHRIEYWSPKSDWSAIQTDIIQVRPEDRAQLTIREVLDDLEGVDAPLIWKRRYWATPRDWRLLDRLSLSPRLRDIVGQPRKNEGKRWLIAEGFQPQGENDDPARARLVTLPTRNFIPASSEDIELFLLEKDCKQLPSRKVELRRSIKNTEIFCKPHVLVTKGLKRSAFVDFDVAFQHALRGIHGPESDRELLIFLAAYLQSSLARFYLFHTSSNWGVSRAEVHVEELLRLPFPLPEHTADPERSRDIVRRITGIVTQAAERAEGYLWDRRELVRQAQTETERLIEEYFDVDAYEKMLIEDTDTLIIPSVRPSRKTLRVPTLQPSSPGQRDDYTRLLSDMLNGWAQGSVYQVHGRHAASSSTGVGMVVLEKVRRADQPAERQSSEDDVMATLHRLQRTIARAYSTLELMRGIKVFHERSLFIIKPLSRRFWTRTAALNDADEIAATIIMQDRRGNL